MWETHGSWTVCFVVFSRSSAPPRHLSVIPPPDRDKLGATHWKRQITESVCTNNMTITKKRYRQLRLTSDTIGELYNMSYLDLSGYSLFNYPWAMRFHEFYNLKPCWVAILRWRTCLQLRFLSHVPTHPTSHPTSVSWQRDNCGKTNGWQVPNKGMNQHPHKLTMFYHPKSGRRLEP